MSRAGLKDLGKDRTGKRWWEARLYWTDELTGEPRDTKRKFSAPGWAAALVERDKLLEELRTGRKHVERKRFRELTREWVEAAQAYGTMKTRESVERKLNAAFGEAWADAMTTRHVQRYLDALTLDHKSIGNLRAAFIGILQIGVGLGLYDVNVARATVRAKPVPAAHLDEDEDPIETRKDLTPEQLAAYLDDMEQHEPDLYPLIHTQFVLGCRFAEVSALARKRVNLETGIVELRRGQTRGVVGRTKGKRARKAALPLEARAVLKAHFDRLAIEQPRGWEELCFPRPETGRPRPHNYWASSSVDKAIRRSFARCGIVVKGATHVARHTFITIAEGITPSEALLRAVVGHRSKKVHQDYQHPGEARIIHLGDAVGRELLRERARKGRE